MSKKANPTSIGIFIFVGLLLGVCGLLLFTSTKIFTPTGVRTPVEVSVACIKTARVSVLSALRTASRSKVWP